MLNNFWNFFKRKGLNMASIFIDFFYPGVISRGAHGGRAPFVKIIDHFGGLSPLKILALPLLFKVY